MVDEQHPDPSPALFFEAVGAHQRTASIKAAIELEVFTAIGEGHATEAELAKRCEASERGIGILCDYLVALKFLTKDGPSYGLTPDSAMFLDRRSPAYLGGTTDFTLSPMAFDAWKDVAAAVRHGGTVTPGEGTLAPEHPVWVEFARAMAPMMQIPARLMAEELGGDPGSAIKVLDIAAGHGAFGIALAQRNPKAEIVAVDWPNVLEVAEENAEGAGVSDRHRSLPGSAFDVDFGGGYDVVLITNFFHHFDPPTCETLMRKVHAALAEGGRAATLEFIPDDGHTSPPEPVSFSLRMLISTPGGRAYTFSEYRRMFAKAGFSSSELHPLPSSPQQLVISRK